MVKKIRHAEEDELLSSVYGSRSMSRPLPKYRLPEESLPAPLAYQLVHDQLNLDMKPDKNLASFVTTWMEPEAEKFIVESMRFNLANEEEYPHVIQIEERCVNMLARLYHAERRQETVGVATIGSSEAVMRIVVRENLSRDLADSLLADLGRAIAALRGAEAVRRHGKPGHKSKRPC